MLESNLLKLEHRQQYLYLTGPEEGFTQHVWTGSSLANRAGYIFGNGLPHRPTVIDSENAKSSLQSCSLTYLPAYLPPYAFAKSKPRFE